MKIKKITLVAIIILIPIHYVISWVPFDNPMVLYLWDGGLPQNTKPPGAIYGANPIPQPCGTGTATEWYIMCAQGLSNTCTRLFNECSDTFGLCPTCTGDVYGMDGIYGDVTGDNIGDCAGWVTAQDLLYTCVDFNGITTGGQSPWYTP